MVLFAVEHLGKSYGPRDVLKDVSFSVAEREKVAVVGAAGAGKTTLLKIIAGSLKPDSGKVTFFRGNVRVGYLPQDMSFAPGGTVGSELAKGLGHRYSDASQTHQADHTAEAVRALPGVPIGGGMGCTLRTREEVFGAEGRVMEALSRFGLAENGLEQPVSTLGREDGPDREQLVEEFAVLGRKISSAEHGPRV